MALRNLQFTYSLQSDQLYKRLQYSMFHIYDTMMN